MIIVYLRVSTDKQDTDNQRSGIEKFCKQREFVVDKWVQDIVSGGKSVDVRKLGGIVRRMKRGDILVVSEISRLSRNLMDLMDLLKRCMDKGLMIYAVKEGYELGDNINSKVLAFAFGLAAEIERTMISARIREALARKKAAGAILGRPKGSKNSNYVMKRHEAEVIRMHLAGAKQIAIARKFKVHRSTVRRVIDAYKEMAEAI